VDFLSRELQLAAEQPGCPICRLASASEASYLNSFLRESISDPEVRDRLRASLGLCARHLWLLHDTEKVRYGTGLSTAGVLEDLVGVVMGGLELARRKGSKSNLRPGSPCMACQFVYSTEQAYLKSLARRPLPRPPALCLPHLLAAVPHWRAAHVTMLEFAVEALIGVAQGGNAAALADALYGAASLAPPPLPSESATADSELPDAPPCPACAARLEATGQAILVPPASEEQGLPPPRPAVLGGLLCKQHGQALKDLLPDPRESQQASSRLALDGRRLVGELNLPVLRRMVEGRKGRYGLIPMLTRANRLPAEQECPACRQLSSVERLVVDDIAARSTSLLQPYSADALCLNHLLPVLHVLPTDQEEALAALVVGRLKPLQWELREYIRKHAWENRHEPKGQEQSSWTRATRFLAGERGAF